MTTEVVGDEGALGVLVRKTRTTLGMSQTELARDAKVGRQWLVAFEAGDKYSAPLDMIFRILRELDIAVTLQPATPATPAIETPTISATEILRRYDQGDPTW